jgi:hypothetical protein
MAKLFLSGKKEAAACSQAEQETKLELNIGFYSA